MTLKRNVLYERATTDGGWSYCKLHSVISVPIFLELLVLQSELLPSVTTFQLKDIDREIEIFKHFNMKSRTSTAPFRDVENFFFSVVTFPSACQVFLKLFRSM